MIDMSGYEAENQNRADRGEAIAYNEEAFCAVPAQFGLEHNQVVEFLMGGL